MNIPGKADMGFILIDNDENAGAKCIFDTYAPDVPFPCRYFVEANRRLAHVRNRVREGALTLHAMALAMSDDNEIVAQERLGELCKAFNESRSDGAHGPVDRLLTPGSSEFFE
jgi:hypothetical protein